MKTPFLKLLQRFNCYTVKELDNNEDFNDILYSIAQTRKEKLIGWKPNYINKTFAGFIVITNKAFLNVQFKDNDTFEVFIEGSIYFKINNIF